MISQHDLKNFTGTENHYKGYLGLIYTDGIHFLVEKANCYWLLSDIASVYFVEPKVKANRENGNTFLIVDLKINRAEKTATLFISEDKSDGEYINLLYKQEYKYTDISQHYDGDELNFYLIDGTLILPSEY